MERYGVCTLSVIRISTEFMTFPLGVIALLRFYSINIAPACAVVFVFLDFPTVSYMRLSLSGSGNK